MKKTHTKPKGFIAIVSLLIVAAIAMIFSMMMLLDGVDNASLSLNSIYYENARINMVTCLEDILYRIRQEEQFSQSLDYDISDNNTCSTSITWYSKTYPAPGMSERLADLDVTGVSNGFSRTFRYALRIAEFDVNYSDGSKDYMKSIDFISINELTS
jgi:hypothetical protein